MPCALCLVLAACAPRSEPVPYNQHDFAHGGPDAPFMNERTGGFMDPNNPHFGIEMFRPKTPAEKAEMHDRWESTRVHTRWQEYRGTMIRVQVMLGSTDMREMRLKLVQNANGMGIDGDAATVLGKVADFEMRRVCGRRARHFVIIYDRPSFEVLRPTPYFDFMARNEGSTMREYGFRCIY